MYALLQPVTTVLVYAQVLFSLQGYTVAEFLESIQKKVDEERGRAEDSSQDN